MLFKELIWNAFLLIIGIFFVAIFPAHVTIVPGFEGYNMIYTPLGLMLRWEIGVILSISLMIFRYAYLALLAVKQPFIKLIMTMLLFLIFVFWIFVIYCLWR